MGIKFQCLLKAFPFPNHATHLPVDHTLHIMSGDLVFRQFNSPVDGVQSVYKTLFCLQDKGVTIKTILVEI